MPTTAAPSPGFKAMAAFRPITVDEYDKLIDVGILTDEDKVELLEGYVVLKMPSNPPHDTSIALTSPALDRLVPAGWGVRCQCGTRLSTSRPEPDVAVTRGDLRAFARRRPNPADLGLVVEVSDSSLDRDQLDKTRIYARDGVPVYWIVNLVDRRVEVYTDPSGPGDDPQYLTHRDFPAGSAVPVELDGAVVGTVAVDDLLP